ncbi:MAG TPA: tripartite tricarboxylate transporter substrate binding protein [Ramlibacter sp.]|nr:tripartite tricarboxylate transporter substrate binding protein [Ramlibacter sp.]
MTNRFSRVISAALLAALSASGVCAQDYPSRAIKIVAPFSGGAAVDVAARRVAARMATVLGQTVIVENRPGAGGSIGADYVAKAAPDGYTLLMGTINTNAFNPGLYKQLPYDPVRSFEPITRVTSFSNVLVVPNSLNVSTMKGLLDVARRAAKPLAYASLGTGSSAHLAGELLSNESRIPLVHIPYKDVAQYVPDVLDGRVDMSFANIPTFLSYIKSGRVKALAIAAAERSPLLPDVPTLAEVGLTEGEMPLWIGLFAPRGTPPAIVEALNKAARKALDNAELRKAVAEDGSRVESDATPADFKTFVEKENRRWQAVMKAASIAPQ